MARRASPWSLACGKMRRGGQLTTQDGDFAARNGAGRNGPGNDPRSHVDDELPPRLHRRRARRRRPPRRKLVGSVFLIPLIVIGALVGAAAIGGAAAAKPGLALHALRPPPIGPNSVVLAAAGAPLAAHPADKKPP